jgi:hypothetical protein
MLIHRFRRFPQIGQVGCAVHTGPFSAAKHAKEKTAIRRTRPERSRGIAQISADWLSAVKTDAMRRPFNSFRAGSERSRTGQGLRTQHCGRWPPSPSPGKVPDTVVSPNSNPAANSSSENGFVGWAAPTVKESSVEPIPWTLLGVNRDTVMFDTEQVRSYSPLPPGSCTATVYLIESCLPYWYTRSFIRRF